jgi:transcriptional regulator with XRE-family HTH domain
MVTMFGDLLRQDRQRSGRTVEEAARRLGVSIREYRELEAGVRNGVTTSASCNGIRLV